MTPVPAPPHTCHAHGCSVVIPPRLFMCVKHWYSVPAKLRAAIWGHYRPGQEIDKIPSKAYLAVAEEAIGQVAFRPHDEEAAKAAAVHLIRSMMIRREIVKEGGADPLPWLKLWDDPVEGITT